MKQRYDFVQATPRILLAAAMLLTVVAATPTAAAASGEGSGLERKFIEPVAGLYTQIVEVESNGVRTLYVSGQVGPGESLEEQSLAAYGNLKKRLEAAGASVDDIVKLTTYVVDWSVDQAEAAFAGLYAIYGDEREKLPAHTLVGVKSLYGPQTRIEVEATAVVASD